MNEDIRLPRAAAAIGVIVVIGFFSLIAAIVGLNIYGYNENTGILQVALGIVSAAFITIVSYNFGSSWGSRLKDIRPTPVPTPQPTPIPTPQPIPIPTPQPTPIPTTTPQPILTIKGKMSTFGGPDDHGSGDPNEGLALYNEEQAKARPDLFLSIGPGLFRRLNPDAYYLAARWNYKETSSNWLRTHKAKLTKTINDKKVGPTIEVSPVDWGPNVKTGRAIDLSPGAAKALKLETDDECIVEIAIPGEIEEVIKTIPPWLNTAIGLRGLTEVPGGLDNPVILEMARVCGGQIAKEYKHDSIAWCALFVNYCLIVSGHKGNDSLWALDMGKLGTKLKGPAVGAIASKKREGGGHTYFVLGKDKSGNIVGVGGNMTDAVRDDVYDPDGTVSYNWPEGATLPNAGSSINDLSTLPVVVPTPYVERKVTL